jgi:hypothetical protein
MADQSVCVVGSSVMLGTQLSLNNPPRYERPAFNHRGRRRSVAWSKPRESSHGRFIGSRSAFLAPSRPPRPLSGHWGGDSRSCPNQTASAGSGATLDGSCRRGGLAQMSAASTARDDQGLLAVGSVVFAGEPYTRSTNGPARAALVRRVSYGWILKRSRHLIPPPHLRTAPGTAARDPNWSCGSGTTVDSREQHR